MAYSAVVGKPDAAGAVAPERYVGLAPPGFERCQRCHAHMQADFVKRETLGTKTLRVIESYGFLGASFFVTLKVVGVGLKRPACVGVKGSS
jgi:hypothetical protein